jgi:hypothetical protein
MRQRAFLSPQPLAQCTEKRPILSYNHVGPLTAKATYECGNTVIVKEVR